MRDVIASYEALVSLFERIQFFLQRFHHYTSVALTPEMTELLAKIMAQILSTVFLLFRPRQRKRRISWSIQSVVYSFLANYTLRNIYEAINGKDRCGRCVSRLDTLTKEENLMTAAGAFESVHRVDNKVTVIEDVLQQVDGNVSVIQELTRGVDDNVKGAKSGTPIVSVSL